MDWLAQHHPFGTKKMKEESKLLAESVREEFETNYNAFLDRHDPEVLAEKRVEKRKREERKREFGLDEIKVADTPAVHAEKRGFLISDSLTQIGNFLGQSVNTPQLKQLSEQTILLRRIEQNTGKKMGVDFPL
jgi:hypothetical protein